MLRAPLVPSHALFAARPSGTLVVLELLDEMAAQGYGPPSKHPLLLESSKVEFAKLLRPLTKILGRKANLALRVSERILANLQPNKIRIQIEWGAGVLFDVHYRLFSYSQQQNRRDLAIDALTLKTRFEDSVIYI